MKIKHSRTSILFYKKNDKPLFKNIKILIVYVKWNYIITNIFTFYGFCRKLSPGIMPPGSPGIFRRKSSSSDEATLSSTLFRNDTVDSTKMSGQHVPWANTKEDYELKEVIGKSHICINLSFAPTGTTWCAAILWQSELIHCLMSEVPSPLLDRFYNLSSLLYNKGV